MEEADGAPEFDADRVEFSVASVVSEALRPEELWVDEGTGVIAARASKVVTLTLFPRFRKRYALQLRCRTAAVAPGAAPRPPSGGLLGSGAWGWWSDHLFFMDGPAGACGVVCTFCRVVQCGSVVCVPCVRCWYGLVCWKMLAVQCWFLPGAWLAVCTTVYNCYHGLQGPVRYEHQIVRKHS